MPDPSQSSSAGVPSRTSLARERPPARTRLVRLPGCRLILANPYQGQYGHLGSEILYALSYARAVDAPVLFGRANTRIARAMFEIDTSEVHIVRNRALRLLGRLLWSAYACRDRFRQWRTRSSAQFWRLVRTELSAYASRETSASPAVKQSAKQLATTAKKGHSRRRAKRVNYNRRRLIFEPVSTTLTPSAMSLAMRLASQAGIPDDARLISLHVRERGYKLGREAQDKTVVGVDDSVRNARIESHLSAVDFLVAQGYTVIRLGDQSMTPLNREGVVDIATMPDRHPLLDIYCLLRSKFLLCGESGPYGISFLTNTPLLCVNATEPVGAYPVRTNGIYLLKTVIDRTRGVPLTAHDFLTEEYLRNVRNTIRYEYIENTPAQIVSAVKEMLALLDEDTPEAPSQTWYREQALATGIEWQQLAYQRKWGVDRGFLGFGRLARVLADPWFEIDAEHSRVETSAHAS